MEKSLKLYFILMFVVFASILRASTEPLVIIKGKLDSDDLAPEEKETLLSEIIKSYITVNLDSALYYSDVYRLEFIDNKSNSKKKYECKYYSLLSNIYKEQRNPILFAEQSKRSLECYESGRDSKNIAKSNIDVGLAYAYEEKLGEAIKHFMKGRELYLSLNDSLNAVECSMQIALINLMQGEKDKGLESYFEVLNYYEKIGHFNKLGKLCNKIGLVYLDLNKNSDALHYFQKGLAYTESNGDLKVTSEILINLVGCYKERSEHQTALGYIKKGLIIAKEINSIEDQANFYYQLASTKHKLQKNYEALDAINQATLLHKELNDIDGLAKSLVLKSHILLDLSSYNEAHKCCKECYEISKKTETLNIQKTALDCISRTANALKSYREAYQYQKEYIKVSDSLQVINSKEIMSATDKRNQYQKEKAILEQQNLLNEALLEGEKTNTKLFALLSFISLLGLGFLGFSFLSGKRYTKRIKEKNKLIESNNNELSKLNVDLAQANSKLNNFTSVAAHDLKSPIRTIASYSQLLMIRNKDRFESKDLEMLNFVSQNAKQLTGMIDDLLAFSRINEDLGPAEVVNINEVLQIVTNNLGSVINEENVSIAVEGDLQEVKAHRNLLTQLFQNLISNGIKFKKENTPPVLTIRIEEQNDDTITYSVRDNGIGINPDHHDKIFTIFQRLHTKDEFEGSGIGLATCKGILDYYHMNIWLESEVGVGTKFSFNLPKVKAGQAI